MSSLSVPLPAVSHKPMRRLSVDEYHRMIDAGILVSGEPYELLNGFLVHKNRSARGEDPMTIGHEHLWGVKNLAKLGRKLERLGCHMQTQGPVIMSNFDEPEPDGAIVIGYEDDYKERKPEAAEVTCVIEVSDSSLADDRSDKVIAYANSGIGQYIIINLQDRVAEVYTQPRVGNGRYGKVETLQPNEQVHFVLPKGQVLPVQVHNLLP